MQELPIPCCNNVLNVDVEAIGLHDICEVAADGFASGGFELAVFLEEFFRQCIEFVRGGVGKLQETIILGRFLDCCSAHIRPRVDNSRKNSARDLTRCRWMM